MTLVHALLLNLRTKEQIILGKYPNIPYLRFKKGDKLSLSCMMANNTTKAISIRIEYWVGNRLYGSIGRDSIDSVSQIEDIVKPNAFEQYIKHFIIADRDLNGVLICATLTNYTEANHLTAKLVLVQ